MDSTDKALKDLTDELMQDPVTREKVEKLEAAKHYIVEAFPECDRIKKSDIQGIVSELFVFAESYRQLSDKLHEHCHNLWPAPEVRYIPETSERTPEYTEWYMYFYGDSESGHEPFYDWVCRFEESFIQQHGFKHTFEEACGIAADWWKIMIFEEINQDAGNDSVGGLFIKGMCETQKRKALMGLDVTEVSLKFRENIFQYYLGGCQYRFSERYTGEMIPSVDYGPNGCLIDVLVKSGVPKSETARICPWKTTILVDNRDNSVVIKGYHKESIL